MLLDPKEVTEFVDRALAEDIGRGDLTTLVTIPEGTKLKVAMVARQPGVVGRRRVEKDGRTRVEALLDDELLQKRNRDSSGLIH